MSLATQRKELERAGVDALSGSLAEELRGLAFHLDRRAFPSWMVSQLARNFASVLRVCSHFLGEREQSDPSLPLGDTHAAVLASIQPRPLLTPALTPRERERVWEFLFGLLLGAAIGGGAAWIGARSLAAAALIP